MGDSERRIREVVASGPFSAGQVSAEASFRARGPMRGFGGGGGGGGGGFGGGGGGGGSGGPRIKTEGGLSYGGIKAEDGGYISSDLDEAEEGPRKNIDYIDLVSDDEDQGTASTNYGMAPIRVSRVEHRDREKPVAADSKSKDVLEASKSATGEAKTAGDAATAEGAPLSPTATRGKQRARDVQVVRTERKWKGAWEDSEEDVQVKPEPMDEDSAITAQPIQAEDGTQIKESASPETRRKSKGKAVRRPHGLPTEAPQHQTQEERREWERHHLDLEIIRQELGEILTLPPSPTKAPAAEPSSQPDDQGDTKMTDDTADTPSETPAQQQPQTVDKRADRVYLFQFPPILPSLRASAPVKPEPQSPTLSRKVPASTEPITIDADTTTTTKPKIKSDPDIAASAAPVSAGQSHTPFPSGLVGKLRVHQSGRTTLDWGGTALQVGMGTDVQFLQDVLVAKFFEQQQQEGGEKTKEEEEREFGGEVMGLGQVKGKFVVTPDWEEIVGVRI